jgi:hypothetical protein
MFWMIVTRFFCKTETMRDFPYTLKAGIFSLKRFSLFSLTSVFDVGSALTETENWDLLVDCTSRDGRKMLDAGVHLSDKRTLLMKTHIPFQKQWCIWRSHLCPLKLICHIKDVKMYF